MFNKFKANWKTTLAGLATLAVAGGATMNGQPISPELITTMTAAIGLVFAGDAK